MDEFELTYLAKKELMPMIENAPCKAMLDIYIPASSKHPHLRIRKLGDTYEMTKKLPKKEGDASHQIETTIPLALEEFQELNLLEGKRVYKNRYYHTEAGLNYEVDVFQGDLKGLVLVDVEFKSQKEKSEFAPPSWVLADVTQEDFVAGGMLCGKKYADIQQKLEKFGYKKI